MRRIHHWQETCSKESVFSEGMNGSRTIPANNLVAIRTAPMPASEAQIRANRENSKLAKGATTAAGREASRANSYKHGLTATTVLPEREAAEVDRRYEAYCRELKPTGEVGNDLVLRAAILASRMERCVAYETAILTERVRRAEADFEAPEGVDEATAARLRTEAGKRALFDDSREATLSRKYEAAAERGFFRSLKELRTHERAVEGAEADEIMGKLGSFSPGEMTDEEFDKLCDEEGAKPARKPDASTARVSLGDPGKVADVPIAIGRPR
jgi:hypothetical protein